MPNITPIQPPATEGGGGGGGGGALDDEVSKALTYTDGVLTFLSSTNGTKTYQYTGDQLSAIIATGSYKSKTITYNLDGSVSAVTVA
jgi:hypothetical protein